MHKTMNQTEPAAAGFVSRERTSTRRSVLLGTVATIASVGTFVPPAWAQIAAPGSEDFLKISRALTGHDELDSVTASRIFNAMSKADPAFTSRAAALSRLVRDGDEPKALLAAADQAGLRDMALAIVSAWYTGTVGAGAQAVVVSYVNALMYRPVADGLTVPAYCGDGPLWWTRPVPAAGIAPPKAAAKNG